VGARVPWHACKGTLWMQFKKAVEEYKEGHDTEE